MIEEPELNMAGIDFGSFKKFAMDNYGFDMSEPEKVVMVGDKLT